MTAKATGHYTLKPDGLYLQFDRLFHAPIEEVWFSLTNPTAMQAWIGTYTGRPETGGVRSHGLRGRGGRLAEREHPRVRRRTASSPTRARARRASGCSATREAGGMTTLTFGQKLPNPGGCRADGARWDYYLDRPLAARAGRPLPEWEHYYPALAEHYQELHVPAGAKH